ncbi:MAG: hypothetical protein NTW06_04980, partial [Candidatus Falkowbacteria bacterium]|nr:hypothetical protein [Candidatus Falkowbacteria bacterium]
MITYLAIAGFLSAIVNLFLVIIVLWRNHKSKLNIVFSMACFTIMFYSFFYGLIFWPYPEDKELVLSFYQLATLGHLLTPALFFHFVALRLNVYEKYKRLIWLAYITLGFIALFSFTPLVVEDVVPKFSMPLWGVPGILWYAWSLIYSVYLTLVIYLLISHYRISTGIRREQIKYILIGSLIWVVSSGCNNLLWFNINFPPYLMIFTSTWGPIIVYSIVNYGLLDVKLILRKSTVYFLSIATIILGAQGIKIIVNYLISPATSIPVYGLNLLASINFWFDLPILIISLLIFQPIKDWYFKFANKYFFSSLYDSNELIADLSYKLRTTLDINMVFEYLIESLIKSFHVNSIGVCLYNQDKNNYEVQYNINFNFLARKEFPIDKKLFDRYLKKDRIVVVDEIKNFDYEENKAIVDVSDKFGVEVLVPLNFKYKIIGILLLGQKESKDVYNKEDIKTLGIISGIAANALENSKLYEDVSESNKNLKILLNAKSDFLRVVNHQLNTPLSIIKMG